MSGESYVVPSPACRVTELALCESEHLVLRANQLYIFRVMPGCERCQQLASLYEESTKGVSSERTRKDGST